MKKVFIILTTGIMLIAPSVSFSQTAVDFTADDCDGNSHHLFSELDEGKIVVISFVMPCITCIGPTLSALSTVQNYAISHPGKVVFYIVDDAADSPCSTISAWANNNEMTGITTFSNPSVVETPYGLGGMPKIVVLGGVDHKVYFIQNNGLNTTNLTSAINEALASSTGVNEESILDFHLTTYPNPAIDRLLFNYVLTQSTEVSFDIYNLTGSKVKNTLSEKFGSGAHEGNFDIHELKNGVYFLKMSVGKFSQSVKFIISR